MSQPILQKDITFIYSFQRGGSIYSPQCGDILSADDHVSKHHKGVKVLKIERENNRYDVDLANGWELTFDKNFNVVDVER